ncbi:FAD-binding domain-containing protein [Rhizobium paknamense]|uniref:Deoxyribodipyrimidine photo-lyase n=1 Tax=Rhizobium paknamense TaxID=1206817 RepID=A0ABU0IKR1_9HYPH|nr:deoxyribodipyrimidine photo-lyase [Rhizobium paknamense]MDQ0457836.1 deoxyribodipyrimidine photo-lyase [Rhizobium paknamense]
MSRIPNLHLVWFKRDLRIHDHRPLREAAAQGPVLPIFMVEPGYWRGQDVSARHYAFLRESLLDLQRALAALGQPLVIRTGEAVSLLAAIHRRFGLAGLWSHQETGNDWTYRRDLAVAGWCRENGVIWTEFPQDGVIRRLASRQGWAGRMDGFLRDPRIAPPAALSPLTGIEPGAAPDADTLELRPDTCPERQRGGRQAGLQCLSSFLLHRGEGYRKGMSSPNSSFAACSRLSPHLALGTLSVREVMASVDERGDQLDAGSLGWKGALSSFRSRLYWRSHFMQKLEDQPNIEFRNLHPAYDGLRGSDCARLAAWQKGETGLPFVDACMRALHATGWMNFRMRAMLMAVASYHLWLDWRAPGLHLARMFTDYEPGIHWSQVQMQSGVTGINTIRMYNPVKQGLEHDAKGRFIRRWLPELASVPDAFLHEPWTWEKASTLLDRHYPLPIVDHVQAAREARQKVWAIRGNDSFRKTADGIQKKHGSRGSGLKASSERKKPKASGSKNQLSFDF